MQAMIAAQSSSVEKENAHNITANISLQKGNINEAATTTSLQKNEVEDDKLNSIKQENTSQHQYAKPSSSADNLSVVKTQKKNVHRKKQVRFHESTKTWDGLRSNNALLQQLIVDFFANIPSVVMLRELLIEEREHDSFTLCSMLDDLILRIKKRALEGALLLPKGDSKCIKLHSSHLPRLEKLRFLACAVHDKIVANIAVATK